MNKPRYHNGTPNFLLFCDIEAHNHALSMTRRIKLHPVTGVPIVGGDAEKKKPEMGTVGEEEEEEEEEEGGPIMIAKRTRGETPEEKKARKELAKQVTCLVCRGLEFGV
jgi:hypothetical protein